MRVSILDYFRDEDRPKVYEGNRMQVEQAIRNDYFGVLSHIAFGDLDDVLATLDRMSGVHLKVEGYVAGPVNYFKDPGPERVDPWIRESDDQE